VRCWDCVWIPSAAHQQWMTPPSAAAVCCVPGQCETPQSPPDCMHEVSWTWEVCLHCTTGSAHVAESLSSVSCMSRTLIRLRLLDARFICGFESRYLMSHIWHHATDCKCNTRQMANETAGGAWVVNELDCSHQPQGWTSEASVSEHRSQGHGCSHANMIAW